MTKSLPMGLHVAKLAPAPVHPLQLKESFVKKNPTGHNTLFSFACHRFQSQVNSLACLSRLVTIWPFWPPSDLGPPPWLQPRHPPGSPLPVFADSVSSGLASPPQPLLLVVQDSVVRTVPVAPADTTPLLPPGLVGAPPPYSLSTLGLLLSVALLTRHYHR